MANSILHSKTDLIAIRLHNKVSNLLYSICILINIKYNQILKYGSNIKNLI